MKISVIVANYNYERYVGAAIESALAVSWPDLQVIVVDDGSTDDSRAVISRFGCRIKPIYIDNSTQRVAVNIGFAASDGDIVVFLDSDDLLPPDLGQQIARVYKESVSKYQFSMQRIDSSGASFGPTFPRYGRTPPTSRQIRSWATHTTAYPTPPGSGNAYSRSFLDKIFPLDSSTGDFADSACLAAAPFLGDVVCLPQVVVGYRQHGRNDSALLDDLRRFGREVQRARSRWNFVVSRGLQGTERDEAESPLTRSRELLQLRVVAYRVDSESRGLPGDGFHRLLANTVIAPLHPGPEGLLRRLLVSSWCLAVLMAPRGLLQPLLRARYRTSAP